MATILIDANIFVDMLDKRRGMSEDMVKKMAGHTLCLSPLSIHIACYVGKRKIPDKRVYSLTRLFKIVPLGEEVYLGALAGPTADFEDNVQLMSGTEAECDYFMTKDRALLTLGAYAGMVMIEGIENI